jgi:hypothetical protein
VNNEDAEMTARFLMGVIIGVLVALLLLNVFGCTQVNLTVGDGNTHESDKGLILKPKGNENAVPTDARNKAGKLDLPSRDAGADRKPDR